MVTVIQEEVGKWLSKARLDTHPKERALRLCEETLELVQSVGVSSEQVHLLVDYVFGRPVGDPPQELAGTMLTLAALANSLGESLERVSTEELRRINTPERILKARRRDQEKLKAGVSFGVDRSPED